MHLSCIETINLDLDSGQSHLVVYGWVTNEVVPYEIKLTRSNGYSDQTGYPSVSGAEVFVRDEMDNRYDFQEYGSSGSYFSDPAVFVGMPGSTYQLIINIGENTYRSSPEEMPHLGQAEDAFVNFIADPSEFNVEPEDENFFISAFIVDDPDEDNYYRWKVYVNDQFRNQPEELVLFDDQFTNGNRFRFDAGNVLFTESDESYFQHMSLSKGAYEYYQALRSQTVNLTVSPRVQPGIIVGNLINQQNPEELVLGYFGASEVTLIQVQN